MTPASSSSTPMHRPKPRGGQPPAAAVLDAADLPNTGEDVESMLSAHAISMDVLRETAAGHDYFTDARLLRFLIGHHLDIDKAQTAVNASVQWRIDNHIDAIRDRAINTPIHMWPGFDRVSRNMGPMNLHCGAAYDGSPLTVEKTGKYCCVTYVTHINIDLD